MKSKQVLDVHQMQHLQELGMDTSNANAEYYRMSKKMDWFLVFGCRSKEELLDSEENIPAYTLQDVLDELPDFIEEYCLIIDMSFGVIRYDNLTRKNNPILKETYFNDEDKPLIDAAYEMLCWAIEQGYLDSVPDNHCI